MKIFGEQYCAYQQEGCMKTPAPFHKTIPRPQGDVPIEIEPCCKNPACRKAGMDAARRMVV